VAAGIEAGHPLGQWEAVRSLWGPYRLSLLYANWRRFGPPSYVSLAVLAGTGQGEAEPEKPKTSDADILALMAQMPEVKR
jgi:hypothetical protein